MTLTPDDLQRYQRQIQLPGIGHDGQVRLKRARVLMVGVGGLGSPASLYLAAAGIGFVGLIDDDSVSISNLQRQILYENAATGKRKVSEAKIRLENLNPLLEVRTYDTALTGANAVEIFSNYDLILDGTDNFKTRYLISKACIVTGRPHVYAGIFRFEGQVAIFDPSTSACYRCLFPNSPNASEIPNCSEAGVLGALPGVIGSLQALEALKYILQLTESQTGRLFVFDALHLESRVVQVSKRANCDHCSRDPASLRLELLAPTALEQHQKDRQLTDSKLAPDSVWIDVRSEGEFQISHRPGALNIPLAALADKIAMLEKNQTYTVYCASGQRSHQAQALMMRHGFNEVWNLRGGLVLF